MKTSGNTVLITGGGSGIGLALTEALGENRYEVALGAAANLLAEREKAFSAINR